MDETTNESNERSASRRPILGAAFALVAVIVAALLVANRSSGEPQATESPAAAETTTTSTPPVDSDTSAVETTTTAVEIADAPQRAIADVAQREANEAAQAEFLAEAIAEGRTIREIDVWVINNGLTDTIQRLTPVHFSEQTGIAVNFAEFSGPELRERVVGTSHGDFPDAYMISAFEAPQFGGVNGWIQDLTPLAVADPDYDLDDIIPSVRELNSLEFRREEGVGFYAAPFYAESSILMFNQEIMDAAGIVVPDEPTWQEIAEIAEQVHSDDVAGICLRGLGGWSDLGASLTSVVNTFGGTWWEANDDGTLSEARINQPDSGFRAATELYVDLVTNYGPDNAASSSFPECLELMNDGAAAMWFDTTNAPSLLEGDNFGFARAPVGPTGLPGGGLWSFGLAIPDGAETPDAAWEFISWVTSPEYIELVGLQDGWQLAPGGTRISTYEIPDYQVANEAHADVALAELLATDPSNPGTTPRPGLPGVQYVGIPEFQDIGTRCTLEISAAIAGDITVDQALDSCQTIAAEISQ